MTIYNPHACHRQRAADQDALQEMSERLYRRDDADIKQLRVQLVLQATAKRIARYALASKA